MSLGRVAAVALLSKRSKAAISGFPYRFYHAASAQLPTKHICNAVRSFHASTLRASALPKPTTPGLDYTSVLAAYGFLGMDTSKSYTYSEYQEAKHTVRFHTIDAGQRLIPILPRRHISIAKEKR
jgi:hypothetical protein